MDWRRCGLMGSEVARGTTTHQYRSWRKQVLITQRWHGLSDPELALVMYTQVKGRAKQLLEILEVKDLEQPGGLAMIWSILDRAHAGGT